MQCYRCQFLLTIIFLLFLIYVTIDTYAQVRIEKNKSVNESITNFVLIPTIKNAVELEAFRIKKLDLETTQAMQNISIKLNEDGESLVKRYPALIKVNKQPAGLNFYKINWDSYPQGVVKIEHGQHSFVLENVLGIMGSQDLEIPQEGIDEFSIYMSLAGTPQGLISHDEARLKTYALLKKIELTGWRNLISEDDPRITGKDRLNYVLKVSNLIGLDTKYIPTLEEWMSIENLTSWTFYADHQYLRVDFKRERTLLDPAKPGSYLLTFSLKSETENFRGYVGPDNRSVWKQKLPAALDDLKQRRQKAEATLRAQGISIDETYQDPPVPDLK